MEQVIVIILVIVAVGFMAKKKLPRLKVLSGESSNPCGSCEGCPYGGTCEGGTSAERKRQNSKGSRM